MSAHAAFATLNHLFRGEAILLIGSLAAIVGYQLLTGKISLDGIFFDKHHHIQASRLQMLMTSVIVAGSYLADPHMISTPQHVGAAAILGGSNILYLVHKSRRLPV